MNEKIIIAVDIDDTLTDTARKTFELAKKSFDHKLSVEDLLFRYSQPGEVPEWKTKEVDRWLEKHLGSAQYLSTVPVVEEAQKVLKRLSKEVTIGCYITSRQHYMREMTATWLKKYQFPVAQLITRGEAVKEKNWKLIELQEEFHQSVHLIDDSLGKMDASLLENFSGKLLWYNPLGQSPANDIVQTFASWQEIETFLTN